MSDQAQHRKKQTVTDLPVGKEARVVAVHGSDRVSRRLLEMGVVPGTSVGVIKSAPFVYPIEVRVRWYNLAMRRAEARSIEVAD